MRVNQITLSQPYQQSVRNQQHKNNSGKDVNFTGLISSVVSSDFVNRHMRLTKNIAYILTVLFLLATTKEFFFTENQINKLWAIPLLGLTTLSGMIADDIDSNWRRIKLTTGKTKGY